MNTFKKSVIAIATISTIAMATAAPAHAGKKWKKAFGAGLGFGVGLGVAGALLAPRQQTVVVQQQPTYVVQPRCYTQARQFYDAYGVLRVQHVQVCN